MPTDPDAAEYLEEGLARYKAEDYEGAVDAFRRGYGIEPDPTLLFAWAQAERMAGHCAEAVELYDRFLDTDPPEQQAMAALDAKGRCADELMDTATTVPEPAESDAADEDDDDAFEPETFDGFDEESDDETGDKPARRETERGGSDPVDRPWHRDPLGASLVAVGVAGLAAGGGLMLATRVSKPPTYYPDFVDYYDRMTTFGLVGPIVMGVGGALVVAGAVRWGLLAKRQKESAVAVAPVLVPGKLAGLQFQGRF